MKRQLREHLDLILSLLVILSILISFIQLKLININKQDITKQEVKASQTQNNYWLMLHRKSNKEFLFRGEPGNKEKSDLIKVFNVKAGRPNERPTPLPHLIGQEYFLITEKLETSDPETKPYFLTLNVPGIEEEPYGPVPYEECNGQCNWVLPGKFGLHGVNGDGTRLDTTNPGSSGCVRHTDEDIAYLYNLLDPETSEVRYYVYDL